MQRRSNRRVIGGSIVVDRLKELVESIIVDTIELDANAFIFAMLRLILTGCPYEDR